MSGIRDSRDAVSGIRDSRDAVSGIRDSRDAVSGIRDSRDAGAAAVRGSGTLENRVAAAELAARRETASVDKHEHSNLPSVNSHRLASEN